jgi:hypothetical protein
MTMAIGIPEIHSCGRRMVEFIRRLMIAEPVSTILGEPKFLGHGIPIEADGIPDTSRDNLIPASVLIDTSALIFTKVYDGVSHCMREDLLVQAPMCAPCFLGLIALHPETKIPERVNFVREV